ncbi:MAG: nucleotidyltransferase family protein [Novosphingobium sp.]|nr:nucleotidyltransferase family protein [Novosphingobium sp.]
MSGELGHAKRALLALLGGRWPEGGVSDAQWDAIAAMAAAHRLEPLLHWRAQQSQCALPAEIAAAWDGAHRGAALAALAQQAALRLAVERLGAAGVAAVALKGVRLAWRDYPAPGLRPMRDLDLLVPAARALDAAAVLAEAGFEPETSTPLASGRRPRREAGRAAPTCCWP